MRIPACVSVLAPLVPAAWSQTITGDPSAPNDPPAFPSTSDPSTRNILGTRLFGWEGCSSDDRSRINEAYYDMSVIAETEGIYTNIQWNEAAAQEFLGPGGPIPDQRKTQIQSVSHPSTTSLGAKHLAPDRYHVPGTTTVSFISENTNASS